MFLTLIDDIHIGSLGRLAYLSAMSEVATNTQRKRHGAHQPWGYRPEAFRWMGEQIVGINFLPLARDMRAWLLRRGNLSVLSITDTQVEGGFTNPYTFSGVSLTLIMAKVVNDFHQFCTTQTSDHNEVDAEIERLRLYNEIVLYAARICEAAIKQLLYCTQFPGSRYKRMALGSLLESACPRCKNESGREPHTVSFVGSLAHPFHLCLEFEHCAMEHMDLVNKIRNSEAAHSGIQTLHTRTVEDSKTQLLKDGDEVLSGFLHMLSHVEQLETGMLGDLELKGQAIILLKRKGLGAKDCNFNLTPGEPFVFGAADGDNANSLAACVS